VRDHHAVSNQFPYKVSFVLVVQGSGLKLFQQSMVLMTEWIHKKRGVTEREIGLWYNRMIHNIKNNAAVTQQQQQKRQRKS
jgi:hypothetical protein